MPPPILFLILTASSIVGQMVNQTEAPETVTKPYENEPEDGWGFEFEDFKHNYLLLLVIIIFIGVAYLLLRQDIVLLKKVRALEEELGTYDSELVSAESKEFGAEFYRQV